MKKLFYIVLFFSINAIAQDTVVRFLSYNGNMIGTTGGVALKNNPTSISNLSVSLSNDANGFIVK
jgi:hypothetical protein